MKNKVLRSILLVALSAALYAASVYLTGKASSKTIGFMQGGAAGLALAGTISFIAMLVDYTKGNRR